MKSQYSVKIFQFEQNYDYIFDVTIKRYFFPARTWLAGPGFEPTNENFSVLGDVPTPQVLGIKY